MNDATLNKHLARHGLALKFRCLACNSSALIPGDGNVVGVTSWVCAKCNHVSKGVLAIMARDTGELVSSSTEADTLAMRIEEID